MTHLFLALALVLSATQAIAQEDRLKWMQRPGDVIEGPIHPDMCVEVHWTDLSPEGDRITVHYPPLTDEELRLMTIGRDDGRLVLTRCELSDS